MHATVYSTVTWILNYLILNNSCIEYQLETNTYGLNIVTDGNSNFTLNNLGILAVID